MTHMIETNLARSLARRKRLFAKIAASGRSLVFYSGEETDPATWLEAGRALIDERSGVALVSRHAVNLILEE